MQTININLDEHLPVGYSSNAISIRTGNSSNETLTHVVIGDDFIAGSSVSLRHWVVMPSRGLSLAQPMTVASRRLPPIRQLRIGIGEYLAGLKLDACKLWRLGSDEPLPTKPAMRVGQWLALLDSDTETADYLVPIDAIVRVELSAVDNSLLGLGYSNNLAPSKN